MGPHDRDWSAIPEDVLLLILRRLSVRGYVRFGAVCVTWNCSVRRKLVSPAPQLPWLLYPDSSLDQVVCHEFSNDVEVCRIKLPEFSSFIKSTSSGHILFLDEASELLVLNPLTGSRITFPSITTLPQMWLSLRLEADLLSRPNTAAVVALAYGYGEGLQVAFSRAGDETWTMLGEIRGVASTIIFHKEILYVVTETLDTTTWDLLGGHPPRRMMLEPLYCDLYHGVPHKFLVESTGGDLLQVCLWKSSEYPLVYKLDAAARKWCRVRSLCGDDALLLSRGRAVCVSTHDLLVLRPNCIYSTLKLFELPSYLKEGKNRPLQVYDLGYFSIGYSIQFPIKLVSVPGPYWFSPCITQNLISL